MKYNNLDGKYNSWLYKQRRLRMLQLSAGTVLEREYKGNKVKVKVLKNGNLSYNGKEYEDRGALIKAITKGKAAQFTTFFGLNKKNEDAPKKSKKSASVEEEGGEERLDLIALTLDSLIRDIVRSEIKNYFRNKLSN